MQSQKTGELPLMGWQEYHKFLSEVNLGIPAVYISFFCLSTFLLLNVGQDDKIQISKLQCI